MQMDQHEGRGEEAHVAGVHPRVQVSNSKVKNRFELSSSSSRAGRCRVCVRAKCAECGRAAGLQPEQRGGRSQAEEDTRGTPHHASSARTCAGQLSRPRRPKPALPSGPKMVLIRVTDQLLARAGSCTGAAGFKPVFSGSQNLLT